MSRALARVISAKRYLVILIPIGGLIYPDAELDTTISISITNDAKFSLAIFT